MRGLFHSHRDVAKALGVSCMTVIVIERRAIAKLVVGLGLYKTEELPAHIRKFLGPEWAWACRGTARPPKRKA
jgi:hypothetical protein